MLFSFPHWAAYTGAFGTYDENVILENVSEFLSKKYSLLPMHMEHRDVATAETSVV